MRPHFTTSKLLVLVLLLCSVSLVAQSYPPTWRESQPRPTVEILSDTRGVNFGPYLKDALEDVRLRWLPVVPKAARAPRLKRGTVVICFAITRDGEVNNLRIEESSGDRKMNRAAFNSIRNSSPFPPLPREFDGQSLVLRLHFYYNPAPVLRPAANPYLCDQSSALRHGHGLEGVRCRADQGRPQLLPLRGRRYIPNLFHFRIAETLDRIEQTQTVRDAAQVRKLLAVDFLFSQCFLRGLEVALLGRQSQGCFDSSFETVRSFPV